MTDDEPAPPLHDPALHFHNYVDPHRHQSRLRDIILGGQDGLVNVLGVVLGVAAATQDVRVVLAAGLAAALAESVSMGAVAYTSTQAERALYLSEKEREHRHIARVPQLERSEIREIYRKKGFSGPLLERIVETITADPEVWVAVMMAEELKLTPVPRSAAWRAALVVGVSAIVGSLLPLLPFLLLSIWPAIGMALGLGVLALFVVGAYQALTTVGRWWKSGLTMAAIGMASALVGYGVGALFKVPAGAGG
jgi:VIT1/CCC1 family predicted Fe2+/Mn2+ transporter